MRNLKRVLSLTLASVMLMGMMVVGSAAKGYDDVSETDNVEAIEVLQAIEVMVGDERGFGPERPVNRAEMAVVMGKLLSLDYNYYTALCPFTDVYDWAQGWVGACYANKIVSGRGDGIYDPGATVTAVEAASMLMRALGYFQYQNDYADGFELATVTQGKKIGIFDNVGSSASEPMTRNQVAQMVLNALQSGVVEPDGNTINLTTPDGTVLTGKVNYVFVTSNKPFATAISGVRASSIGSQNDSPIVELGERLYDGKLKLTDDYDPFGRPARNWEFDGKNIGVYAKKELVVFEHVGSVTGKDLYDVLGSKTIEDYELTVNLDGVNDPAIVYAIAGYDGNTNAADKTHNMNYVFDANDMNRNNKATVGATGTGVLTQVYVDHEKDTIDIAIINTYLALADKDYDSKKEELAVTVYDLAKHTSSGEYVKDIKDTSSGTQLIKLAADEFPVVVDAAKDEAFLLTVAEGKVQTVVPAEVLAGVSITSFKRNDNVVVDGTTYKFDTTARFDTETLKLYTSSELGGKINLKDLTYNVYLDTYGNLIGVEEIDPVKNYVFITGIDSNDSNLVNRTADVNAIFLDGTMDTIRVNMAKSNLAVTATPAILNTWCTYTVNSSGVYTVNEVVSAGNSTTPDPNRVPGGTNNNSTLAQFHQYANAEFEIDKKNITLTGGGVQGQSAQHGYNVVYGDKDSVYITAKLGELNNSDNAPGQAWGVIKDVESTTTGVENTNLNVWTEARAAVKANDTKTSGVTPVVGTTSYGVYTLYNNKGIVIAAVVVGEDNGASRNLVYVHSDGIDYEEYNGESTRASGDGLWTWTRKVISNGEEVTLKEVSDSNSYLTAMRQYNWYQIKTNGKGEVIGAYYIPGADPEDAAAKRLDPADMDQFEDYTLDYYTIRETINKKADVVLYFSNAKIDSRLNMIGHTLFVATDDTSGFVVRDDVNYVIQQWNSNKKDTFIEPGSGADNLQDVIKEINERYGATATNGVTYTYRVSAVLENGVATSVVIWDDNNDYVRPGSGGGKTSVGGVSLDSSAAKLIPGLEEGTELEVMAGGDYTLNIKFEAPDWANAVNEGNNDLTFDLTLYVNGKAYAKANYSSIASSDVTAATADKNTTFSIKKTTGFNALTNAILIGTVDPDKDNISVEISNVKWKYAAVEYKSTADGAIENGTLNSSLTGGYQGAKVKVGGPATGSDKFSFKYTAPVTGYTLTDVGKITYSIENAELKTGSTEKKENKVNNGDEVKFDDLYAISGKKVVVTIGGITKDGASEPSTENTYFVRDTDANETLQFAASETGPWTRGKLEGFKAGATVYVKAVEKTAGDNSTLTAISTIMNDDTSTADASTTASAVTGQPGVMKFTMPGNNVAVKGATVERYKAVDGSINSNMDKVHLKLSAGSTEPTGEALLNLAAEYINANKAKLDVDGAVVENTRSGGTVTPKLFITKDGLKDTAGIPASAITAKTAAISVDVETKDGTWHVVTDGQDSGKKLGAVLTWVGITSSDVGEVSTGVKPYLLVENDGTVSAMEFDTSDTTNGVSDGDKLMTNYDAATNKYVGYVKVAVEDKTTSADVYDSGKILNGLGTVSFALKIDGTIEDESEDLYLPANTSEQIWTIEMTHETAGFLGDSSKQLKAAITADSDDSDCATVAADPTSGATDWTSAASVTGMTSGARWDTPGTKTFTVKVTGFTAKDVVLDITLTVV